jgi:hypothetical protein
MLQALAFSFAAFAWIAPDALAAPANPAANMPIRTPASCSAPTSPTCENAVVAALDAARTTLGLGPYTLPADFDSLPAANQLFVLSNLDRVAYGLPVISGLSPALSNAAAAGVSSDADPNPSAIVPPDAGWSSNWAGGFANAPLAYYEWMYDDGLGSPNLDCRSATDSGCWGHRQDVLAFAAAAALVMGAAAGVDTHGQPGYALTIVATWQASTSWTTLNYTWSQALADIGGAFSPGANSAGSGGSGGGGSSAATTSTATAGPSGTPSGSGPAPAPTPTGPAAAAAPLTAAGTPAPTAVIAKAVVRRHAVRFVLRAAGGASGFDCALVALAGASKPSPQYVACGAVSVYTHLAAGTYTFYVRALGPTGHARTPVRRSFSIR